MLDLSEDSDNRKFLQSLLKCSGGYCIILINGDKTDVFIDACAQFEIFYDLAGAHLTNNPLLIPNRIGEPPAWMLKYKLCVFDYCGFENVKKLRPNHYLDFNDLNQIRYFPIAERPVTPIHFDDAVTTIANILSGTLKAFANRQRTVLPVTAGYDSRILLAASSANAVEAFIYRHPGMASNHLDIQIGKALAEAKGMKHSVYTYDPELQPQEIDRFSKLFFPRIEIAPRVLNGDARHFPDALLLNGNMGEIARTYYGVNDAATPNELSTMLGYKNNRSVTDLMKLWKDSVPIDYSGKDNLLDLFYWEERMGNWASKAKSELRIATRVVSPMNNHHLWQTVLGVKHKYRATVNNKLFLAVIERLDKRLLPFPINPGRKTSVMKAMVKTKIYSPYKKLYWKIKSNL